DPGVVARRLCSNLAARSCNWCPWFALDTIADRMAVSKEDVVVGAAYAHARGWAVYTARGIFLTNDGRSVLPTEPPTGADGILRHESTHDLVAFPVTIDRAKALRTALTLRRLRIAVLVQQSETAVARSKQLLAKPVYRPYQGFGATAQIKGIALRMG